MKSHLPRLYWALLIGALLWCAAFSAEPWLAQGNSGQRQMAAVVTVVFAPVCHQAPQRCWSQHGHAMPVCARCAGLYWGFLLGLLLVPWLGKQQPSHTPRIWLWGAAPLAVEFLLEKTGAMAGSLWLRSATGLLASMALTLFMEPSLIPRESNASQHGGPSWRSNPAN